MIEQPGVAPVGEDQVGVVGLQNGGDVDKEGTLRLERQSAGVLFVADLNEGRQAVGRVDLRLEREQAQRRRQGIQFPGGIAHLHLGDDPLFGGADAAVCQREDAQFRLDVERQGNIGVVVGQFGEVAGGTLKDDRLGEGILHLHCQHGDGVVDEQVFAAGAAQATAALRPQG